MCCPGSEYVLFILGARASFCQHRTPEEPGCFVPEGIRASGRNRTELGGSKAPSQNLCLNSLHGRLQQPLPSRERYFKEDVCRWQLGHQRQSPRPRGHFSPPTPGRDLEAVLGGHCCGVRACIPPALGVSCLHQAWEPADLICRKTCCVLCAAIPPIIVVTGVHVSRKQRGSQGPRQRHTSQATVSQVFTASSLMGSEWR